MSVSMTANACWTSFSNFAMVVSNFYACPCCFLFSNLVNRVRALVLLDGCVSVFCVKDLVLCAGAVVLIIGICFFFLFLCLAIVDCSALGTAGMDIVGNCLVVCVIDIVWRVLLLLLFSGTLNIFGSNVFVVGVSAIYVLWWIARSVILIEYRIVMRKKSSE